MMFLGAFLNFTVQLCRIIFQSDGRHDGTVTVRFGSQRNDNTGRSMNDCSRLSAAFSRRFAAVFQVN